MKTEEFAMFPKLLDRTLHARVRSCTGCQPESESTIRLVESFSWDGVPEDARVRSLMKASRSPEGDVLIHSMSMSAFEAGEKEFDGEGRMMIRRTGRGVVLVGEAQDLYRHAIIFEPPSASCPEGRISYVVFDMPEEMKRGEAFVRMANAVTENVELEEKLLALVPAFTTLRAEFDSWQGCCQSAAIKAFVEKRVRDIGPTTALLRELLVMRWYIDAYVKELEQEMRRGDGGALDVFSLDAVCKQVFASARETWFSSLGLQSPEAIAGYEALVVRTLIDAFTLWLNRLEETVEGGLPLDVGLRDYRETLERIAIFFQMRTVILGDFRMPRIESSCEFTKELERVDAAIAKYLQHFAADPEPWWKKGDADFDKRWTVT